MYELKVTNAEWLLHDVLADVLTPPPPVDYLQWAIDNVVFTERLSDMPGPYNAEAFSYFNEILGALSPLDPCRIVTLSKSAQIGGTVLANIFTLGTLHMAPCDFLYVHPVEGNARKWSKTKLAPLLKETQAVKDLFPTNSSREGGDSVLYKERIDGRGAIIVSGANSPSSLSMISIAKQVQDDLSKWDRNSAGDPEKLADSRSQGYEFAKIFKISTPLVLPDCKITKNFENGSQEYLYVPCPNDTCGHMQTLDWENFLERIDEDHPERAHFYCPACGGVIQEHHRPKMLQGAEWRAKYPDRKRYHRSFYLWSAYSLLQSFERIARSWIDAKGDPASEQTFLNDVIGRAYKGAGDAPPWEELRDRASLSEYKRGKIPAGYPYVTCGVDCQDTYVAWHVVAWAPRKRRAVVEYGTFDGHISDEKCQAALNGLLKQGFENAYGRKIQIDLVGIDGNAWTEDVWEWVKKHPASRVVMVRGRGQEHIPLLERVKKERNKAGKILRYSKRFYNFAASVLKMAFYRNVRKEDPEETGYVLFPTGLDDDYFKQITAESRRPKKKNGFTKYEWVKDPDQANEGLDTMNQAESAWIRFAGVSRDLMDEQWRVLFAERECPPEEIQGDFEDLLMSPPAAADEKTPSTEDPPTDVQSDNKWRNRTR